MDRESGIITKWNEDKGFGFITPDSRGNAVFFHINDYSPRHKRPMVYLEVRYLMSTDAKGRICAIDVVPAKGHRNNAPAKKNRNNGRELAQKFVSVLLFGLFSCVLFYLYDAGLIPIGLICLYALMSVATFVTYAKDKNAAEWGEWRTSEAALHALSLLGGWPGAGVAQSFLRHKSRKLSFRFMYWVTVLANCGVLFWLVTPDINGFFQKVLDSFG